MQSKYFTSNEMSCRCGCGLSNVKEHSFEMLNEARKIANVPFVVNRSCSCPSHNESVGGSDTSSHLTGYAFDIHTGGDSTRRFAILNGLIRAGFRRIGVYKTFIHADNDPTKPAGVVWLGK